MKSTSTTTANDSCLPIIDFGKPDNVAYFNNSGKTPLPLSVQEAGQKSLQQEANPWSSQSSCTDEIRASFSQIIHASCSDIAIVPSTGFAMTLVAHNLHRIGKLKHKRVLIIQDEMSSEVYAWQEVEVEFVIVPHPETEGGWTEMILQMLQSHQDIDVCCVPQVHWSDGSYIDLKLIGHYCDKHDITFVVDGTQSVGVMHFDVKEIKCHVLACSVHKWLLGPHGMSLMYIHPDYHDTWLPLDQHERSRSVFQDEVYDAIENNIGSSGYPDAFVSGAVRCDSGGKNNPILQPMISEGLRIVKSLDLDAAQAYLKGITDQVLKGAEKFGFGVQPGPRAGHIIGLRPKSPELVAFLTPVKMVEVKNKLWEKDIFLAVRCGAFRISPYLNTTNDDVKRLLDALEEECKVVA